MVLNNIIGTGVFILPGTIGAQLGWMSVVAWIVAALLTVALMLCFAEVASRFSVAGGAYLFTQVAFGRFVGLQIGWLTYFSRAVTAALQANVFTTYLAELWPRAGTRFGSVLATTLFIGFLTAINLQSVRSGARTSTLLASIKLASLFAFGLLGMLWIAAGNSTPALSPANPTLGGWLGAILLLLFAYSGYESALIPLGEATNPRRDSPFALFLGLALVTVVYLAAQVTVLVTLPDPSATNRPLAASMRTMLGEGGAIVISVAALISVYGWLAANLLAAPRLSMAMAERGDLPAVFARVHPVFRTPWVSVVTFGLLSWALANQASLLQNLGLSAVSRLFIYGGVCASLPVLRRKEQRGVAGVGTPFFRAPIGTALALFCMALSVVLASRMTVRETGIMVTLFVLATVYWLATGRTKVADGESPYRAPEDSRSVV